MIKKLTERTGATGSRWHHTCWAHCGPRKCFSWRIPADGDVENWANARPSALSSPSRNPHDPGWWFWWQFGFGPEDPRRMRWWASHRGNRCCRRASPANQQLAWRRRVESTWRRVLRQLASLKHQARGSLVFAGASGRSCLSRFNCCLEVVCVRVGCLESRACNK